MRTRVQARSAKFKGGSGSEGILTCRIAGDTRRAAGIGDRPTAAAGLVDGQSKKGRRDNEYINCFIRISRYQVVGPGFGTTRNARPRRLSQARK